MSDLRIGFMGTPDFALEALKALYDANKNIVAIYSQPPRPKGRGHKVQPSLVHQFGLDHDIPVFTPVNLKSEEAQEEFAAQNLDVAIVAAYGLLLPEAILDTPTFGCINIHASLLPRWRGASPIQHAIWHDDPQSGVTLMQMDKGLDTGGMLVKQQVPIIKHMTSSELHDALCGISREMIVEFVTKLEAGEITGSEDQNAALSSYAPLLKKGDGRVDWSQNAAQINCQIRALNPWPGVWTMLNGKRFKILEGRVFKQSLEKENNKTSSSSILHNSKQREREGSVLNSKGAILCGDNTALQLHKIQPQGKQEMDFVSSVNGGYIEIGDVFS